MKNIACMLILATAACGGAGGEGPKNAGTLTNGTPPAGSSKPAISNFAKRADSLKVDKIAGNDGNLKPDGRNDAAFDVTLRGPIVALYLFSTNDKGEPDGSWQYDTIVGKQAYPAALKSLVAAGGMTAGMGVFEGDKVLNRDDGAFELSDTAEHKVSVYFSDIGAFQPGAHFKLVAETADHALLSSNVVAY